MCIWDIPPENRLCQFCHYPGTCEKNVSAETKEALFERYLQAANKAAGGNVLSRSRRNDLLWGRYILIRALRDASLHPGEIAKLIGIHRTSVLHALSKAETMLGNPKTYPKEYDIWNRFRQNIDSHRHGN